VSIGLANEKGYFQNQRLQLIEDKEGNLIIRTRKRFRLDVIEYNPISEKERAVFAAAVNVRKSMMPFRNKATTEIWHKRLAHTSKEAVSRLEEVAEGIEVIPCPVQNCETCLLAKAKRQISRRPPERATKAFERVRFDLIQLDSADNGDKWIIHFLDDATGWHTAYTTHTKSDLRKYMDIYLTWIERQYGAKPQRLFSDQERTLSTWYIDQCDAKGIKIEHSVRHAHDQNGKIESAREAIIIMARSLLLSTRLPSKLWNYAVQAAVYIDNRRPRRNRDSRKEVERRLDCINEREISSDLEAPVWVTPYEKLYGKKPNLANLRVYGCRAYICCEGIPKLDKMAPRAWVGYLVGYTASNIWKIWDPKANTVTDKRDVKFLEEITFDPDNPFHTLSVRVEMPQEPVIIQQLPDIPDIEIQPPLDDDEVIPYAGDDPSGGAARGDVEVESRGVPINDPIGENAEISEKINESGERIDQSELVAEINEPQLLTPEPTPSPNAAQSSEIIHTPTRPINQQRIPGAWEDSPYIAISTN
jgi:hypothetical protein